MDSSLLGAEGSCRLNSPPAKIFLGEIILNIDGPIWGGLAAFVGPGNSRRHQDAAGMRPGRRLALGGFRRPPARFCRAFAPHQTCASMRLTTVFRALMRAHHFQLPSMMVQGAHSVSVFSNISSSASM